MTFGEIHIRLTDVILVVFAALAAAVSAYAVTSTIPPSYDARTTLLVGSAVQTVDRLEAAQILTETFAELATTRPVLDAVIASVGLNETADELRLRVDAIPVRDTLRIIAHSNDPVEAAAIANGVANELLAVAPQADPRIADAQRSLLDNLGAITAEIVLTQAEIARLQSLASPAPETEAALERLKSRLTTLQINQATLLGPAYEPGPLVLRVVDPAISATRPTGPNIFLNTGVALMVGFIASAAIILVIRRPRAGSSWRGDEDEQDGEAPEELEAVFAEATRREAIARR